MIALFRDIVAAPDDFDLRVVYADALMDRGDLRGEFMQAQLAIAERVNPATRKRARYRAHELLKKSRSEFLVGLEVLQDVGFKHGFVDSARLNAAELPALVGRLFGAELPTSLTLENATPSTLQLLVDQGLLGRLRTLKLVGSVGAKGIGHLARTSQLHSIRCLNLSHCELDDAALAPLLDSSDFQCASLTLNHNDVGNATAYRLASCGTLRRLFFNFTSLGDEGLERMAFAPALQSLERLGLCHNDKLTEQCLDTLRHPDCLPGLHRLDFNGYDFDVPVLNQQWKGAIY